MAETTSTGAESSSPQVFRVVGDGGSPSSAESNFRELDDVFLQTQARIWLGEVLQMRLNEQINIADLLADGELLFEVSREVWSMLLTKRMELRGAKSHKYDPFAARKSGGRYRPYSNVDSFLKVCKILGLTGIDLFSPSDVVEKRNTRKVCMCIRSLSKKSRSRHLSVPDFDIVTYTIAMPTNMVGYIRRSWELSHCSSSSSASHSSYDKSRRQSSQKYSDGVSRRNYDFYSDEYDDTDGNSMLQSDSSTSSWSCNASSHNYSELLDSPEVSSLVKDHSFKQSPLSFDHQKKEAEECTKFHSEVSCLEKSSESLSSLHYVKCDHQLQRAPSPSFIESNGLLDVRDSHELVGARNNNQNSSMDLISFDPHLEDSASVVGDSDDNRLSGHDDDNSEMSIFISGGTCESDDIHVNREDGVSHACEYTGSCVSRTSATKVDSEFRRRSLDADDIEVSSVASMNSTSGALQKLDLNDHLDMEEYFRNILFPESSDSHSDNVDQKYKVGSECQEIISFDTPGHGLTYAIEGESLEMKVADIGFSSKQFGPCSNVQSTGMAQLNSYAVDGESKGLDACQSDPPAGFHQWDQKGKHIVAALPVTRNNRDGASVLSNSQVNFEMDTVHFIETKATGSALWLKNNKFITVGDDNVVHSTSAPKIEPGMHEPWSKIPISFVAEHSQNAGKTSNQVSKNQKSDPIHYAEGANMVHCSDDGKHEKVQKLAAESAKDLNERVSEEKPQQRRLIIKSVIGGTAALGALFLFLHLRKNNSNKAGELSDKQSSQTRKANAKGFSSRKERKSNRTNGSVYPAEKLKFGK